MLEPKNNNELPVIPGKRYFTIGEVSELCGVKPHVLRYWEQEYEQGFTIGGARNKLTGDDARTDTTQSQQIVRQLRTELEDVLRILRR